MQKILIIEKKAQCREILMNFLPHRGAQFFSFEDGINAIQMLGKHKFEMIFSDAKGTEVLAKYRKFLLGIPLIFLKNEGDQSAVDVDEILHQPFEQKDVENLLHRIGAKREIKPRIIAESQAMKKVIKRAEKIAKSYANVFISGESGTGKEVIAQMIHAESKRNSFSLITVNCAALSETLIESEFFGHEKGAFTGAHAKRIGRFELADKGTLLLDEISEIPAPLQAKLLRVVQEQEFERVGGRELLHIDVRIISTSNRNMKEAIKERQFREDLYYRLNVVPIFLPPLRERIEDIIPLAEFFLSEICKKNDLPLKILSEGGKQRLRSYSWPGNIRELRNVIEQTVIMDYAEVIEEEHLFLEQTYGNKKEDGFTSVFSQPKLKLKEVEKIHILETLKECGNNRTSASKRLGISVRTLRNKLNLYQIDNK